MKKILITALDLHYNNINNSLVNYINNIDFKKYEVDLLVFETGELILEIDPKVKIKYYKDYMLMPSKIFYNFKKRYLVEDLYDLFRYSYKYEYDIAIAFYGDNNYIDMIPASVNAKTKLIFVHDMYDISERLRKTLIKKYSYFDNIIFTSKENMFRFLNILPGFKEKILYINNFIDSKKIIKLSHEKTNINLGKSFKMINISNFESLSSILKIMDIHIYLKERDINILTYIIGSGKYYYDVVKEIKKRGIASSFVLLGKQENIYNLIKQADLYINISRNNKFNTILLESNILDVPFITNDNNVNEEIISLTKGNIITSEFDMYEEIKKIINTKVKCSFNYKHYEKDNYDKIKELMDL